MSLSEAIAKNASLLATAQSTYLTDVTNVTSAVTGVSGIPLPVLNNPPSNWTDFVATFDQAKANANDWSSNVLGPIYSAPNGIINNNSLVTDLLGKCATFAKSLQTDPDPAVLAALKADLSLLSSQLGTVAIIVSTCQSAINDFDNDLPPLITELQTLVTDFTNLEGVDQQAIATFQQNINQLYADIQNQVQVIVDDGIAIAAAGAGIYIGVTVGWTPVGVFLVLVCVAVVAVAALGIDMASQAIQNDKQAIASNTAQMNAETADVAACVAVVKAFNNFLGQIDAVQTSVQNVLDQWNTLRTDVQAAIADVTAAIADTGSASYAAALTDIANASTEWNSIDQLASSLNINVNYTSATVTPGMTQTQVQGAVAAAPSVPILQHLNGGGGGTGAMAAVAA